MKVSEAANKAFGEVIGVQVSDSLLGAAEVLISEEIGAVAVYEGGSPRGILSERDLVRAVADRIDLNLESVDSYMTEAPVTIDEEASIEEATGRMLEHQVRHLVVTRGDDVVGMLSSRDILGALGSASER